MDENVKIETERQTQCQIAPAHIQSYNLNKLEDHSQNEESCTISKMSQNEITETSIKKISTQISERLNLGCASPSNFKEKHTKKGVNGIVNGFDNCQHNISNGTTEDSDKSSSHFEKYEISSNPASNPESEFSKPTTTTPKCDEFANCTENKDVHPDEIHYVSYQSELQMPDIMRLIQKDLSEPYSIYTYRYFIHNWPKLCFLAMHKNVCVGAIVCKLDIHRKVVKRGYIAMLAVDEKYRNKKIGSNLVLKAIRAMIADEADEVVLETEITNRPALQLYENLGFVRDKRLFRYYLNGVDALRLKLWLR